MSVALLGVIAFSSCSSDDEVRTTNDGVVRFTTSIDETATPGTPQTKAAGTGWTAGDAIGIFMVANGGTTVVENATNRKYTTTGTSTFTAASGQNIYYPMDGSAVDFIAYYPYSGSVTALSATIQVNVAGTQTATSQADIDLLWAKTNNGGAGYDKVSHATTPVALAFDHKLSKLVINCKADANVGVSLNGMTVSITGMDTKNTLTLSSGVLGTASTVAAITPNKQASAPAGFSTSYDAIILPKAYAADVVEVLFTLSNGEPFVWKVPAITFVSGTEYTYEINLTRTGVQFTGTIKPWLTGGGTGIAE